MFFLKSLCRNRKKICNKPDYGSYSRFRLVALDVQLFAFQAMIQISFSIFLYYFKGDKKNFMVSGEYFSFKIQLYCLRGLKLLKFAFYEGLCNLYLHVLTSYQHNEK